jgi:hypothetical protein
MSGSAHRPTDRSTLGTRSEVANLEIHAREHEKYVCRHGGEC